ncbi:MAG: hypothetical protein WDW38_009289 [Sanguina aurantia]
MPAKICAEAARAGPPARCRRWPLGPLQGSKCLSRSDPEIWRLAIDRGGRILFEVAVEFNEEARTWMEMIRIWAARAGQPHAPRGWGAGHPPPQDLPGAGPEPDPAAAAASAAGGPDGPAPLPSTMREHFPPASYGADTFTLLKFYNLDAVLVKSVLQGLSDAQVDFPFKVSPKELDLITKQPNPPSSMILLGRSGTGKTTCAVYRIWGQWLTGYKGFGEAQNVLFVTASATLRLEVAKAFRRLQAAVVPPEQLSRILSAAEATYHNFKDIPAEAFPLFLPAKTYLRMMDGTIDTPFFPRRPNGAIIQLPDDTEDQDPDGMALTVDLDYMAAGDDDDDDGGGDAGQGGDGGAGNGEGQAPRFVPGNGGCVTHRPHWPAPPAIRPPVAEEAVIIIQGFNPVMTPVHIRDCRDEVKLDEELVAEAEAEAAAKLEQALQGRAEGHAILVTREVTFTTFVSKLWKNIVAGSSEGQRVGLRGAAELGARGKDLRPSLLWQEICSYLKGSAEAVASPRGVLSREDYLSVGRKRAPNFSEETRRQLVYPLFEIYQNLKREGKHFDNMDLVAHVYQHLNAFGYKGTQIHGLYRDEVQDFTQAEMLLDLRVCCDPNSLFYCGDTAQTIARGIGFRFADIRTLFHEENIRRIAAGGDAAAVAVATPEVHQLTMNYRTHQGILDVAAVIVDMLRNYFPLTIDKLDRENALFEGPHPLLLGGLTADDLCILLSGSDRHQSQVEFGAHQVILVRSMEAMERLPAEVRNSNAIIMTVPQAKGLEFSDVFIVNFFSDSEATQEWRVLNSYLEEMGREAPLSAAQAAAVASARSITAGAGDQSMLRELAFDAEKHLLLAEELKHLYTAITRAKNNVVIFDSNEAKRQPFYNLLQRRGLARTVQKSLLEDGADAVKYGLTQMATSSREEWAKRGANLYASGNFGMAAKSYMQATDMVRAAVCDAMGFRAAAAAAEANADVKKNLSEAAKRFLAAVAHSDESPEPVTVREKQKWARIAVKCITEASTGGTGLGDPAVMISLYLKLGQFKNALDVCNRDFNHRSAAEVCIAAATAYSGGEAGMRCAGSDPSSRASPWLRKAVEQFHRVGDYSRMMGLLEDCPGLAAQLRAKFGEFQTALQQAAIALNSAGDHQRAIAAIHLLPGVQQEQLLSNLGYYRELASLKAPTDPLGAASLLFRFGMHDATQDESLHLLCSLPSAAASWPSGAVPAAAWELLQRCCQRHASLAAGRGSCQAAAVADVRLACGVMRDGWEGLEEAPQGAGARGRAAGAGADDAAAGGGGGGGGRRRGGRSGAEDGGVPGTWDAPPPSAPATSSSVAQPQELSRQHQQGRLAAQANHLRSVLAVLADARSSFNAGDGPGSPSELLLLEVATMQLGADEALRGLLVGSGAVAAGDARLVAPAGSLSFRMPARSVGSLLFLEDTERTLALVELTVAALAATPKSITTQQKLLLCQLALYYGLEPLALESHSAALDLKQVNHTYLSAVTDAVQRAQALQRTSPTRVTAATTSTTAPAQHPSSAWRPQAGSNAFIPAQRGPAAREVVCTHEQRLAQLRALLPPKASCPRESLLPLLCSDLLCKAATVMMVAAGRVLEVHAPAMGTTAGIAAVAATPAAEPDGRARAAAANRNGMMTVKSWKAMRDGWVLPMLRVVAAGRRVKAAVNKGAAAFPHWLDSNSGLNIVSPGLLATFTGQADIVWGTLLVALWPVISPPEFFKALLSSEGKNDNFGLELVLKKGQLGKSDMTVWLNTLLDSKKGAPDCCPLSNRLVIHPAMAYAMWRMWALTLQQDNNASSRLKHFPAPTPSIPRSLYVEITTKRTLPEEVLQRAFDAFNSGSPQQGLKDLLYYISWSAARDKLGAAAGVVGSTAVLPLEVYVELLEIGCTHMLLGIGEAALLPGTLLHLLQDIPQMSSGFAAGAQLTYWQIKTEVKDVRGYALHTSQLMLLLAQQLSFLVPAAAPQFSSATPSTDAPATAPASSTAGSSSESAPPAAAAGAGETSASRAAAAAARWVPMQQQITKLVGAVLDPPSGTGSSCSSSSSGSPASITVLSGLQRNLTGIVHALSARTDSDSVSLAVSLATRLLPTASALLLSMQLSDAVGRRKGETPKQKAEAYDKTTSVPTMQGACALLLAAVARGAVATGQRRHTTVVATDADSAADLPVALVPPALATACSDLGRVKVFSVAVTALNKVLVSIYSGMEDAKLHLVRPGKCQLIDSGLPQEYMKGRPSLADTLVAPIKRAPEGLFTEAHAKIKATAANPFEATVHQKQVQHKAACNIQRFWRGYVLMKKAVANLVVMREAARVEREKAAALQAEKDAALKLLEERCAPILACKPVCEALRKHIASFLEKKRAMEELRQQQEEQQRAGLDASAAADSSSSWAEATPLAPFPLFTANSSSSSSSAQDVRVGGHQGSYPSGAASTSSAAGAEEDGGVSQSLNETDRQLDIMKAANAAKKAADMARKVEKEEARLKLRFAATAKVIAIEAWDSLDRQHDHPRPPRAVTGRRQAGGRAVPRLLPPDQSAPAPAPPKPAPRNSLVPSHLQVHPSSSASSSASAPPNTAAAAAAAAGGFFGAPMARLFNSAVSAVSGSLSAAAPAFVFTHIKTSDHSSAKLHFSTFHGWYLASLVPCLVDGFEQVQELNQFEINASKAHRAVATRLRFDLKNSVEPIERDLNQLASNRDWVPCMGRLTSSLALLQRCITDTRNTRASLQQQGSGSAPSSSQTQTQSGGGGGSRATAALANAFTGGFAPVPGSSGARGGAGTGATAAPRQQQQQQQPSSAAFEEDLQDDAFDEGEDFGDWAVVGGGRQAAQKPAQRLVPAPGAAGGGGAGGAGGGGRKAKKSKHREGRARGGGGGGQAGYNGQGGGAGPAVMQAMAGGLIRRPVMAAPQGMMGGMMQQQQQGFGNQQAQPQRQQQQQPFYHPNNTNNGFSGAY